MPGLCWISGIHIPSDLEATVQRTLTGRYSNGFGSIILWSITCVENPYGKPRALIISKSLYCWCFSFLGNQLSWRCRWFQAVRLVGKYQKTVDKGGVYWMHLHFIMILHKNVLFSSLQADLVVINEQNYNILPLWRPLATGGIVHHRWVQQELPLPELPVVQGCWKSLVEDMDQIQLKKMDNPRRSISQFQWCNLWVKWQPGYVVWQHEPPPLKNLHGQPQ